MVDLAVSVQKLENKDKSMYHVASAWTETYINASSNATMEHSVCMRQMRQYDSSTGCGIVSKGHWHHLVFVQGSYHFYLILYNLY